MNKLLRNWKLLAAVVIPGMLSYFWASSPGEVVVRANGSIIGIQNETRAFLQGKDFWSDQRYLAYQEQENLKKQPEQDLALRAEIRTEIDGTLQESRRILEELYREEPTSRPSAATVQANALRDMADNVEEKEAWRLLDQYRRERILELVKIQSLADRRVANHMLTR